VLFADPPLTELDLRVIAGIESYRDKLRYVTAVPRRWNGQLRRNLRARAMRGSNSIEGYDVSLDDAIAILEDDIESLDADQRTVLEVTGYRNAMTYVQQLASDPDFQLEESLLRSLHFMMLGHDLDKSPGSYRRGTVYVRDEDRDVVVYESPDNELVPRLMSELVTRLDHWDDHRDEQPIFVTAAMAHLNLVMIHPFRDGNGRMARCLQTLILSRNQVLGQEFASIEEWLGRNTQAYYDILAETGQGRWNPGNDATAWVRFNLRAHHMQAQTVARRVEESSLLWERLEQVVAERALPSRLVSPLFTAALGLRVRRSTHQVESGVEYATANRDLKAGVEAGLLDARGETRGRHYVGTPAVREIYAEVRAVRHQVFDPYDTLDDIPDDIMLAATDTRLF
jgi:Fic family protein